MVIRLTLQTHADLGIIVLWGRLGKGADSVWPWISPRDPSPSMTGSKPQTQTTKVWKNELVLVHKVSQRPSQLVPQAA